MTSERRNPRRKRRQSKNPHERTNLCMVWLKQRLILKVVKRQQRDTNHDSTGANSNYKIKRGQDLPYQVSGGRQGHSGDNPAHFRRV